VPSTSRSNLSSLVLDAYCADEIGVRNAPGNIDSSEPRGTPLLSKNKFTNVTPRPGGTGVSEGPQSLRMPLTNKANPRHNPALTPPNLQTDIPSSSADEYLVWVFVSPSTIAYAKSLAGAPWTRPIRVSLLYGVGFETNRHGLRTAFATRTEPSALILIPGIEPKKKGDPRWGVGIDEFDLRRLLETAVGRTVKYQTKVVAAFSTGINGLNQTLFHSLIDVSSAERLVIYDCLYEQSSGDTAVALGLAKRRAGPNLKIVVYKCTTGGNSFTGGSELSVVVKHPGLIASAGIVNLFYPPAYTALITFRCLEGAIADGVLALPSGSSLETAFNRIKRIVPARGNVVSSAATWRYVFGSAPPTGKVLFEKWATDKANIPAIMGFFKHLGSMSKADTVRQLIWGNELPGWPGISDGDENHDLLLPDFGWEYLPA
jgi:hypothetical protein